MTEYHELPVFSELQADEEPAIPRAKSLVRAIERSRDFSLIKVLRATSTDGHQLECLVVDVETDEVPPDNPHGILYRERVALCVSDDPSDLVEVLALRKDFPVLMHQNHGYYEGPASLCLYFESAVSVLRTWTPEAFLRRIQWWLARSARDELHPADQPVEHLFFSSNYELVLPRNYDELRNSGEYRFGLNKKANRADEGLTCELVPIPVAADLPQGNITPIEIELPPVVHGAITRDPDTLGALDTILEQRGVDFASLLKDMVRDRVGGRAQNKPANKETTVLLLHIPICRVEGGEPQAMGHRAFFIPVSVLDLGVSIGLLTFANGTYAPHLGGGADTGIWRTQAILPMEVLQKNDADQFRRQSGVHSAGPKAVLIGAGSLGSAMLTLWGRAGWGTWTVIDNDHVKPHNLTRHVALDEHIGHQKVDVAAKLHRAAVGEATSVTPLNANALDFGNQALSAALSASELVIDVSTTLDYPRAASSVDAFARHASAFVTPDGNGAVLLMEDTARAVRLRSLEAQYYRAIINNDWGRDHLGTNTDTFWSGNSCRDISLAMPYWRIATQAGTLAEQVVLLSARKDSQIRIWQRDPERGSVQAYDVPVCSERQLTFDEFKLYIDTGVEAELRSLRKDAFPNETGGILLGYHDFNVGAAVVVAGLSAPPDSVSTPTSFKRGTAGVADAVAEAHRRTNGVVGYIGEWHSHPPGCSASPSREDLVQLAHLAHGMLDDGLPAVQLIIGEEDVRILQAIAYD
ncbi:thiamine biosynthesis protein ThiF [Burkholderia cepacia]|uniref:ThiF family adenylyltransferase n=1 Tax=Burkholderia cepacia TaxID=292 RepID=UPI000759FE1F|nr:ThiF family adenylyltransferase [Burkholderia cepacia]KVL50684.1 thiamine biosynthesis protein ThiF [Burkholderia cepacia]